MTGSLDGGEQAVQGALGLADLLTRDSGGPTAATFEQAGLAKGAQRLADGVPTDVVLLDQLVFAGEGVVEVTSTDAPSDVLPHLRPQG